MSNKSFSRFLSLPVSATPLVAVESLVKIQRQLFESVVISMPPRYLPTDPSAHLFQPPIQVVVLGIESAQVELGIYANPFLELQQGLLPTPSWVEQFKQLRLKKGF